MRHAVLASSGECVDVSAAEQDALGAEGEHAHDVKAGPDSGIDQHGQLVADGVDHPGQGACCFSFGDGLRGASVVALMVCAALVFRRPELAWSAFAAFWTCLVDPGGTRAARLSVMSAFVSCGSLTAGSLSAIAVLGAPAAGAAVFGMVALCTLTGLRKPRLATVGTLASVVAVVAIEQPVRLAEAPLVSLLFLGGGALTILIALGFRATDPLDAARRGIACVFGELREMTAELAAIGTAGSEAEQGRSRLEAEHRRSVREAIQRARAAIERAATGNDDGKALALRHSLASCDGILAGLIALANAEHERGSPPDWRNVLADIEAALTEAARQAIVGRRSDPIASAARVREPQKAAIRSTASRAGWRARFCRR